MRVLSLLFCWSFVSNLVVFLQFDHWNLMKFGFRQIWEAKSSVSFHFPLESYIALTIYDQKTKQINDKNSNDYFNVSITGLSHRSKQNRSEHINFRYIHLDAGFAQISREHRIPHAKRHRNLDSRFLGGFRRKHLFFVRIHTFFPIRFVVGLSF